MGMDRDGNIKQFESEEALELSGLRKINNEPKKDCYYCEGKGHIGRNIQTGAVTPCICVLPMEEKEREILNRLAKAG